MQHVQQSPTQPAEDRRDRSIPRWLLLISLFALFTHGSTSILLSQHPLLPDEREYLSLGQSIADTGKLESPQGDRARRMPLYPALLSLELRDAAPDALPSGVVIIQAAAAWCTTLVIMGLGFMLAGARAGVFAGIISALYQPFLFLQNAYLTESFTIFLLFIALFFHVRFLILAASRTEQYFATGLCSTCVALAMLLRANAVLFIVPFGLDTLLRRSAKDGLFVRGVLLLAPILIAAGAWSARNATAIESWTLSTGGGLNFYLGNSADYSSNPGLNNADYGAFDRVRTKMGLSEAQADRYLYRQGARFILDHPLESLANVFRKSKVWLGAALPYCGPLLPIFATVTVLSACPSSRARRSTGSKQIHLLATTLWILLLGFVAHYAWLLWDNGARYPNVSSRELAIMGLVSLVLFRPKAPAKRLIIGLFLTQFAVAVAFIPLVRIRWVVDGLLILALSIALSNVCDWLRKDQRSGEPGS